MRNEQEALRMSHSLPLQPYTDSSIVAIDDNFIDGTCFEVTLKRNSLGLGLSIAGGPEAPHPFANLIRVKRVFPLQPAWLTGQFREGDILLSAGGRKLTGLGLRAALDVLRSSQAVTTLSVCRPNDDIADQMALVEQNNNNNSSSNNSNKGVRSYSFSPASMSLSLKNAASSVFNNVDNYDETDCAMDVDCNGGESRPHYGEFKVTLDKVNGSLGFSLRSDPDDNSALRHSVRALVREPAISDGRIRPGDKLVSANGHDCSLLSHKELISFLRSLPDENVVLRFYRDASRAQTPVSTPTEPEFSRSHPNLAFLASTYLSAGGHVGRTHSHKQLRIEAKEMVRSLQASRTSLDGSCQNNASNNSMGRPRGLGRPFSPLPANKKYCHVPITNSASSPAPFGDAEPTVETPMSPETEDIQSDIFLEALHLQRLQIEELPAGSSSDECLVTPSPERGAGDNFQPSIVSTARKKVAARPKDLDLFGPKSAFSPDIFDGGNPR